MTMVSTEVPEGLMDDLPDFEATTNSATDEAPRYCGVEGCDNPTGTGPSGRRLKYCADHDTQSKRNGTSTGATPTKRGGWKTGQAEKVETSLNTYLFAICGAMQFTVFGPDGQVIQKTGPALVHEVVVLAGTDKALRDVLIKITAPGKYAGIAVAGLAMLLSVAAVHIPIVNLALPLIPGTYQLPGRAPTKDTETTEGRNET